MFRILSLAVTLLHLHFSNGQTVNDIGVSFDPVLANEGERFSATFTLGVVPSGDFVVSVTSAVPDIEPVDETLTFTADVLELRINDILLPVDNIVSASRVISPFTLSADGMQAQPSGFIYGSDVTVLTAEFVQSEYTYVEGQGVQVCVTIDGVITEVAGTFSVQLETQDGTAIGAAGTGLGDYVINPPSLLTLDFNSNTQEMVECTMVTTLTADSGFEGSETFTVRIVSADSPITPSDSQSTATVTILDVQADCGSPPSGEGTVSTTSGPFVDSTIPNGAFLVGAVASYECADPSDVLMGDQQLTCSVADGANSANWSPATPPFCEPITTPPPATEPPTTPEETTPPPTIPSPDTPEPSTDPDDTTEFSNTADPETMATTTRATAAPGATGALATDDNRSRNIGIGVGVGVGGALVIFAIVLLIVFCIARYKKGQRQSKYILNYSTVYGNDSRTNRKGNSYETQRMSSSEPLDNGSGHNEVLA